ncbi:MULTISPECIES: cytochrome P450 [Arthrobacter]|nr:MULTISPECIES: cytochrome P450 [Arthrobacter]MBT8163013.1 cytochrome P450 [Arthrobacter sp. GN70]
MNLETSAVRDEAAPGTQHVNMREYPFGDHHTGKLEPEYAKMLHANALLPVQMPVGGWAWLVCRYEHVRFVLASPKFSRSEATRENSPRLSPEVLPSASVMAMDPPDHTLVRRAIAPAFTARRMESLRAGIRAEAEKRISEALSEGQDAGLSLLAACEQLPVQTIGDLFGLDPEDHEEFARLADPLTSRNVAAYFISNARTALEAFLLSRISSARSDGLLAHLGDLIDAEELSSAAAVNLVVAVLVGGRGSPAVFLASATALLCEQPERWSAFDDKASARAAVEELLRFIPIGVGGGFVRIATEDVMVGETLVQAGDAVLPAMFAANHDAAVFPDPERLDLARTGPSHLAFGHGIHHCVGAPLARIMAEEFFGALRSRFGELRLAAPLTWEQGRVVRRLADLRVEATRG